MKRLFIAAGLCLVAAGTALRPGKAAGLVIDKGIPLRMLDYAALRDRLLADGWILDQGRAPSAERRGSGTAFVMRSGGAALLARNLDSPAAQGGLFVNQRGVMKEAFEAAPSTNPLRWTSRYGSVTFNQFGREFPLGGMNETGLTIEGLAGPAGYPAADSRPPVNELQWIQYMLDTCGSVKDVLKSGRALRISRLLLNLHYLVADRKGRTAVVEFEAGKMKTFTGGDLTVAVLSRGGYEESLRGLGLNPGSGAEPAGQAGPPPADPFARAALALREYAWLGQTLVVDQAFTLLRAIEQPDTRWSAVYSPRSQRIFLKTRAHRRYKILGLDSLDFSCGPRPLWLSVDTDAAGNLRRSFVTSEPSGDRRLLEAAIRQLRGSGDLTSAPPDDVIRRMANYPLTCHCR